MEFTFEALRKRGFELYESWINGNKSFVTTELATLPPLVAAFIGSQIAVHLADRYGPLGDDYAAWMLHLGVIIESAGG